MSKTDRKINSKINYSKTVSINNLSHFYGINENTVSLLNSLRQFPNYGLVKGFIDDLDTYKKREINYLSFFVVFIPCFSIFNFKIY